MLNYRMVPLGYHDTMIAMTFMVPDKSPYEKLL